MFWAKMSHGDQTAVLCAVAALILAVAAARALPDGTEGPQMLAVLMAPIVIFALLSGRLSEFRAPGGWQARFVVAASAKVSDGGKLNSAKLGFNPLQKETPEVVEQKLALVPEEASVVLTMTLGVGAYSYEDMQKSLKILSPVRSFQGVVVLDKEHRLVAYGLARDMIRLFLDNTADKARADNVIQQVKNGDAAAIVTLRRDPAMLTVFVREGVSRAKALRKMANLNLPAVAVVSENNEFLGVVERERIMADLLTALAGEE